MTSTSYRRSPREKNQQNSTLNDIDSLNRLSDILSASSSAKTILKSPHPHPPPPTTTTTTRSASDELKPTSGDVSLLLPSTFARVVRKRHAAHLRSLRYRRQQEYEEQKRSSEVTVDKVSDAIHALKQLGAHYERLMANSSTIRRALSGFDDDSVIWVNPETQPDFIDFITSLNSQWSNATHHSSAATFSLSRSELSQLVQWAMDPQIDSQLLYANIDSSAMAYQTVEQAFRVFRLAFDDMLQLHNQSVHEGEDDEDESNGKNESESESEAESEGG